MAAPDSLPGPPIRPMRTDDVEAALDLLDAVARERIWMGAEPGFDRETRGSWWQNGLADPTTRLLVVVEPDSEHIVGQAYVHVARYGVAEIAMFLAIDARGRGLGGELLDVMLAAADELGAHKVELQVWPHNEPAIRLYLSRGFVIEGRIRSHYRRASGELWDAILMGLLREAAGPSGTRGSGLRDAAALPRSIAITP